MQGRQAYRLLSVPRAAWIGWSRMGMSNIFPCRNALTSLEHSRMHKQKSLPTVQVASGVLGARVEAVSLLTKKWSARGQETVEKTDVTNASCSGNTVRLTMSGREQWLLDCRATGLLALWLKIVSLGPVTGIEQDWVLSINTITWYL